MSSMACTYCKDIAGQVIVDYSVGDSICTSCGIVVNRDFAFASSYNDHSEIVNVVEEDDGEVQAETNILYDIIYQFDIVKEDVQLVKKKHEWFMANRSYLVYTHHPTIFISALIHTYTHVSLKDIHRILHISTSVIKKMCITLKEY